MAEVALEQVSKRYANGVLAVRDLSLTVADGELIVLVGPSGCGKTTTLRLIAGLEQPTSGLIRVGGRVVNDCSPRARDVAMVFQRPALYPHLSVWSNLAIGAQMRERRFALLPFLLRHFWPGGRAQALAQDRELEGRISASAKALGLNGLLRRRPSQLSGGEQQRVALGRAMVRRPRVYLLDEPLSNLDAPLRAEMRRELHLLHRGLRATMIYVTHDQVEATALGDRVIVLKDGIVQQVDRPEILLKRPRNRFVAGFIGWPVMNFLDGRLIHEEGLTCFETCGQKISVPAERAGHWKSHLGRPVTLGVRPEDVLIAGSQTGNSSLLMEIVLVELVGTMHLVTLRRDNWQLTALVDGRRAPLDGQMVSVVLDMNRTYLFDRHTGLAMSKGCADG